MSAVESIRARLAALAPSQLDIRDDSARHAGHAGAREGGHYAVRIVAARFAGLSTMQRHRLVYDAIGDLAQQCIHALTPHRRPRATHGRWNVKGRGRHVRRSTLSIAAKTPDET